MIDDASRSDGPDAFAAPDLPGLAPRIAPSKPATPRRRAAEAVPEPVDPDGVEPDIIAPVAAPAEDEVMPRPRGPFDDLPEPPATGRHHPFSPVQRLGHAAVLDAARSASGAPTPLAGVPRVDEDAAGDLALGDAEPPFVPRLAGAAAAAPEPARAGGEDTSASGRDALAGHRLRDDAPLYRPRMAEQGDAPSPADEEPPGPSEPAPPTGREPGRAWPLILVGLLSIGAIGYGIAEATLETEEIAIPPQTVMAAPATPQLEPVELADPSPFLAAMPLTAGAWSLTGATTRDAAALEEAPLRAAEAHELVYGDGEHQVAVTAYQLYGEDAARAAVEAQPSDVPVTPHAVGTVTVGVEARRSSDTSTRIMWSNGSAYFEALGPIGVVDELVAVLGL